MAILYPGLHNDAVKKRHMRYAQALVDDGFTFDLLVDDGRDEVTALIREATPVPEANPAPEATTAYEAAGASAFTLQAHDSGLAVRDRAGALAGAVVVTAVSYDNGTALFIRALATAAGFRSRGIGTVLLGMVPQVLGQAGLPTRALITGVTPQARASFVHRAGFVVLEPGDEPPFTFGGIEDELLDGSVLPTNDQCWFFKDVA
jgi:GNAT superfamily N-acetyltransferase